MKKTIALFLALVMCVSLAACGGSDSKSAEAPKETPAAQESSAPAETPAAAAPAEQPAEPAETATPEPPAFEGTELTSDFWTLTYPDGWELDDNGLETKEGDYGYARVTFGIPDDSNDGFSSCVYIYVALTDPGSFRDELKNAGMDLYDVIENGAGSRTTIGGIEFIDYETTWYGDPGRFYRARVDNANATLTIRTSGDLESDEMKAVLDSISFTLEDKGHVDPPYPWNGTPFASEAGSVMVGTYTLNAEPILFEESVVVDDIFSGRIGKVGEQLLVLIDEQLKAYDMGEKLTLAAEIPLEDDYEDMYICEGDQAFVSRNGSPLVVVNNGAIVASYNDTHTVSMAPSGTWGLSFFTSSEIEKLTFTDGVISRETIVLPELKSVSSITIGNEYVLVAGNTENNDHSLVVYDTAMNHIVSMFDEDVDPNGPDYLGSITHAFATPNGFIALDGNMREIYLWTLDGAYIGNASVPDLFGAGYAWLAGAYMDEDGSLLVGLNQERDDMSADEFLVFRVTGF